MTVAETQVNPVLQGLKPALLWKYFGEISKIPRGSKNEAAITAYVLDVAKRLGLEGKADQVGNVVVKKPATPGREGVTGVALQGHLDMVCEKNKDTVHDFMVDPIRLVRKEDYITADGTTLGADNGVAVATNLALMEDKTAEHGPLEFFFTVDEETGLTGATFVKGDFLTSRILINLDSEEEGALYVGCSGGRNCTATWKLETEPVPAGYVAGHLMLRGLRGGHSGLEIDKGHGNSLKMLARTLTVLGRMGGRIASVEGGNKHNAIPREADAMVYLPAETWDLAVAGVAEFGAIMSAEIATVDPGLCLTLQKAEDAPAKVFTTDLQTRWLRAMAAVPHGVIRMSFDLPGLVETSTNVAVLETKDDVITLVTSQRSSVASEIDEINQAVMAVFELSGAVVTSEGGYPGWKPDMTSPILKTSMAAYKELFGKDPEVKAIHAGLECGIVGEKFPGMDMVSMGPTLSGVHTPDERIYIDTVEKYWNLLLTVLKNVK